MLAPSRRDCFDDVTFGELLRHLSAQNGPLRFVDLLGPPPERFFLLRHDVDYSPAAALRLARLEADWGVRATYFLLPNSSYYNLLAPAHASFPRQLVSLGHEVGLHYDIRALAAFPQPEWISLLEQQASLLQQLAGTPVHSIAMHQPGLVGADPFRGLTSYFNAYDDRFARDMPYFSDSCRAWRDHTWTQLTGPVPPRFQLSLHPINWSPLDRGRDAIFKGVHDDLCRSIVAMGRTLLRDIAAHSGVAEHEAALRTRSESLR
jgi:hypothetical protein